MKYLPLLLLTIFSLSIPAADTDPFKIVVNKTHQIKILNQGLSSLEERLEMIERAQKTIDVEYFIYNLDKSGKFFSQALIKKAKEGVKIRMLLDYFMVKNQFSPFFTYEMEKNGIEVKYFNTALNLFDGQYRDHRKILMIDGLELITGGRNIADEYFDLSEKFNFLDRDIKIEGEIVGSVRQTYDQVWNSIAVRRVERQKIPDLNDVIYQGPKSGRDIFKYSHDLTFWKEKVSEAVKFLTSIDQEVVDSIRQKGKEELDLEYSGTCEQITFHSEYPIIGRENRSGRIIKKDIAKRMMNARESVFFDSPYFVVDDESEEVLNHALQNHVKLTLLTNSLNSTDAPYVYAAFDNIAKKWLEKGLNIYLFKGIVPENYQTLTDDITHARFGVHAKTFVFDKKDVVIGTFNFDPRSANYNTEMTISCDNNPELAQVVLDSIEGRMKGALHVDSPQAVEEAKHYSTGFFKQLAYLFFKFPANIFAYLL